MIGKKILVVDDMPIVSQGTALMLESIGYEVDQAASGAIAVELFKASQYAAVIMDFNMPNMNGFECTAILRELEKATDSRIPIICMSSGNDPGMKERCLAADLDDFLDKDSSPKALEQMLLKWIGAAAN